MGASILAIEKERSHVPLERAIMAIRFNDNMIGTQFHPEADAIGMSLHLQTEEKKKTVIENYGVEKWQSMIDHLNDPIIFNDGLFLFFSLQMQAHTYGISFGMKLCANHVVIKPNGHDGPFERYMRPVFFNS